MAGELEKTLARRILEDASRLSNEAEDALVQNQAERIAILAANIRRVCEPDSFHYPTDDRA